MAVDFGALHRAGLIAAIGKFAGVVAIVLADAEYIAVGRRNRRQQFDLGKGLYLAGCGSLDFLAAVNRLEHILDPGKRRNSRLRLIDTSNLNGAVGGIASELHGSPCMDVRTAFTGNAAPSVLKVRLRAIAPWFREAITLPG